MKTISAYIVAGGKSSRMGTDKGLLPLNNSLIVAHIYNALQSVVGDSIKVVSSNKEYDFLGCPRIEDIIPDKGPVGGIYTVLNDTSFPFNLIVSVDVPLISAELLQWIIDNHSEEYQLTQISVSGKTSPLIAIYDQSLLEIFKKSTESNNLRLRSIVEKLKVQTLEVPEKWQHQVQNINTKEEYQNIV